MEHEVFVPFPADTVRQALVDPTRVARCVPGLQLDADEAAQSSDALVGRLRLRIAGSTITYRGSLHVTEQDGGDLAVEAQGKEVRGGGSAKLALIIRLTASEGGTVIGCTGTVTSDGRLAEADDDAATAAARRLLDRFADRLASGLRETAPGGTAPDATGEQPPATGPDDRTAGGGDDGDAAGSGAAEATAEAPAAGDTAPEPAEDRAVREERPADSGQVNGSASPGDAAPGEAEPGGTTPGEASPREAAGDDAGAGLEDVTPDAGAGVPETPPDGALARRTMVGRSAEEVDHAPPRGRYAPVPAPEPLAVSVTLRWAAPAAAVVVASAVVLGRLLRRRRP